jgi:hypothetical protein
MTLVGSYIASGTMDKELSSQWCLLVKRMNVCLLMRLILEELIILFDNTVSQVVFADASSDLANEQSGNYESRGLLGLQKNALSGAEAVCRPLNVVVTEQNNEVQNAKRHMRGAKLSDMIFRFLLSFLFFFRTKK